MVAGAGRVVQHCAYGSALDLDETNLSDDLKAQGLVFDEPQPTSRKAAPSPTASALERTEALASGSRRAIGRAYIDTLTLYHQSPLPFLISRARAKENGLFKGSPASLARAFEAVSPWLPAQGACVFRSFMLMRLLSRAGASDLHWVFGVRTWPFHAHCWVQEGELVLSDYVEALVGYVPIFCA